MKSIQEAVHFKQPKLLRWGQVAFWTTALLLCFNAVALAQSNETDKPNPLELDATSDPLLPNPPVERPLSPLERRNLREDLDELNAQAAAELRAGNRETAFDIWYREIRLRRVLEGSIGEVKALGRVGEIAWSKNYKPEVQLITARLETIQQEEQTQGTLDQPLLNALGEAYRQMRVPGQALAVYEQILADARQQGDTTAQEETLNTIAQLHLAWFDYPKAAATYEELLTMAQARRDRVAEVEYLQELINVYNQAKEPENALRMKERLIESYINQQNYIQIPALKISIGADYEVLDRVDEASQSYQEAYALAWSVQQFAYASDALEKLALLYVADDQPEYALQVYETLITVDQYSYDFYGLMNTYDQMGQIYLNQENYAKALASFQKGLELAQSLKYRETHFARQIERVNQQTLQ
ncbi:MULTISPECIES: tetratricopeptide repeat protein [unclassified Coleofasciculus]|uniref:tetratricopeptide repeat protein n=1 Tax=unclassified Coleofasciculus TaxID=2692782 RepID=UPI001881E614|nr:MULTISPECIES: tetratricopeptide repeat protein [unclassified Coleofasciculus]MBE9129769.1 tetratricopeptide repeat protein [Coleofasciculus sp. LEGE 07081]MBE9148595.1 tetratricopeptide repeat protein [Coleofasciculus sp. LEGE 07092]